MTAQSITQIAVNFGLLVLSLSFLLAVWRVIRGPTLPDRVIALDMLVGIVMGFIALIAIRTGFTLYIDIAISLGLVGFLATVAFARFILSRKRREGEDGSPPEPLPERPGDRIDQPAAPEPAPIAPISPAAVPTPSAASPAALAGSPRAPLSKSEVTKASAAKVKIAKAKARGQAAGAEAMPVAEAGAKAARPKPPRKPAVKVVVKPLAKSADKPEPKPEATPAPKKETP